MDAIPANLCTLVEQLEEARRFHEAAARQALGDRGDLHRERSVAYAAMLAEIGAWQSRHGARAAEDASTENRYPGEVAGSHAECPHVEESYPALLERVYRIHSSLVPAGQSIRAHATGDATDGAARDGPRRAGQRMHC
ncbi:MAG: hypothetical protein ACREP2_09185 [Rhodanobacteraceae bacterium]